MSRYFLCIIFLALQWGANAQELIPFKNKKGKWGFTKDGKIVIECQYETAGNFSEGLAVVSKEIKNKYGYKHSFYGYINNEGVEIIPLKYAQAGKFSDGLAPVEIFNSTIMPDKAFIDRMGNVAFYEKTGIWTKGSFSNGYITFTNSDQQWGYLDKTGSIIMPAVLKAASAFENGFATIVDKNGQKKEIDTNFNYKGTNTCMLPKQWVEGKNGKYGLMQKNKFIVEPKYDEADMYEDNYSLVNIGEKWGIVDNDGKEIIPVKYESFFYTSKDKNALFKEGYFLIKKNGRFGYVDIKGNEMDSMFAKANHFNKGFAVVVRIGEEGWNYIDKSGKVINESEGDLIQSIQTTQGTLELFKTTYKNAFQGVGLRKEKETLIFPYYDSISYKDGVFTCKKGTSSRQILINTLVPRDPTKIEVNEKAQINCNKCKGEGYYYTTETKKGNLQAVTKESYTTSYETKWNSTTNKYDGYKVTKSKPVTTYEQGPDIVTTISHPCSYCNAKGKVMSRDNLQLHWDALNYWYYVQ